MKEDFPKTFQKTEWEKYTPNLSTNADDNEVPFIFLRASTRFRFDLFSNIEATLKTEESFLFKKEFLNKKHIEISDLISRNKLLLKPVFAKDPECYDLIVSNWTDIKTFLEEKIIILEKSHLENKETGKNTYGIEWSGSQADLLELLHALMASEAIKYKYKEDVIKAFSEFLGFPIKNPHQSLQRIKTGRDSDNQSIFLDKLKVNFLKYIGS